MHIPRILLVDDDPALLHSLCDMLTYRLRPAVVIVQASSDQVVAEVTRDTMTSWCVTSRCRIRMD